MSFSVNGTTISMTRGDTFKATITINDKDGNEYTPNDDDVIKIGVKKDYNDETCVIEKVIPNDTLLLTLDPDDTKELDFGTYYYDVQIIMSDGTVDTFIPSSPSEKAKLKIKEEVV